MKMRLEGRGRGRLLRGLEAMQCRETLDFAMLQTASARLVAYLHPACLVNHVGVRQVSACSAAELTRRHTRRIRAPFSVNTMSILATFGELASRRDKIGLFAARKRRGLILIMVPAIFNLHAEKPVRHGDMIRQIGKHLPACLTALRIRVSDQGAIPSHLFHPIILYLSRFASRRAALRAFGLPVV